MKILTYILSVLLLLLFGSCEMLFMGPDPATDNTAIFEEYWKLVNDKFAMFDDPGKSIDRSVLYSSSRQLVNNSISESELFGVLAGITVSLKDGHSYLVDSKNDMFAGYDFGDGIPENLDQSIVDQVYLTNDVNTQGSGLKYTFLENNTIGYIQYRDFEDEVTTKMMNTILSEFSNTKGIILDVRGNTGGNPAYAALMASHFTGSRVYIGYESFKTGPGRNDFSNSKIYLEPSNGTRYLKPLFVLTNISCFSATTTLVYHLNPLSNVTFIGGKTGGGSGSTADGYLANGWIWGLSTSEFIDWEGRRLDNGFDPDISVDLDLNDTSQDEIIEKAISEINLGG